MSKNANLSEIYIDLFRLNCRDKIFDVKQLSGPVGRYGLEYLLYFENKFLIMYASWWVNVIIVFFQENHWGPAARVRRGSTSWKVKICNNNS